MDINNFDVVFDGTIGVGPTTVTRQSSAQSGKYFSTIANTVTSISDGKLVLVANAIPLADNTSVYLAASGEGIYANAYGRVIPLALSAEGTTTGTNAVFTNLTATDAHVTNLTAVSTTMQYIDVTIYELSGFESTGNVAVTGNITATDTITGVNTIFTNITGTNEVVTNLTATNIVATNDTATNLTATNLTATDVLYTNVTGSSAYFIGTGIPTMVLVLSSNSVEHGLWAYMPLSGTWYPVATASIA